MGNPFPRTAEPSSGKLVEKKIEGGNPSVPGNDEIGSGVGLRLTRAARYTGPVRRCPFPRARQLADTESQGGQP
jgi:hypothetical protein